MLAGLTRFQRDTVDHVVERLYGPANARRFLVADETGLGKSLVAKGVIARAIEVLQDKPDVERIDVVYVCSNSDIARQNLAKLDVLRGKHRPIPGRLTLLARHSRELQHEVGTAGKAVNLVSFTPATSFPGGGWQTGAAPERALLFLLLQQELGLTGRDERAALHVLRGTVGHRLGDAAADRFRKYSVDEMRQDLRGEPDPVVARQFLDEARALGLVTRFQNVVRALGQRPALPEELRSEARALIGALRGALARAGLRVLDPDLVILDEFQRFRELLDPGTESGELAHHLFDYQQAKVLLLSATPYKPFTYAEEAGEDHHRDFLKTLEFLAAGTDLAAEVAQDLAAYRHAAVSGQPVAELAARVRNRLLTVMTRQERPVGLGAPMHREVVSPVQDLAAEDLIGFVRLSQLSDKVKGDVSLEYWKSTPYFANFCEGYKLSEKLREGLRGPRREELAPVLDALPVLDRDALGQHRQVDLGNGKLRLLARQTVDAGWWKLLWLPPSLPYLEPAGPYAEPWGADVTKRLVFSSWAATPTAIASLLSQRVDHYLRSATVGAGEPGRLLDYRLDEGRAAAMTTLALFWPMPELAQAADPLRAAGEAGAPVPAAAAELDVLLLVRGDATRWTTSPPATAGLVALARPGSLPEVLAGQVDRLSAALGTATEEEQEAARGVRAHVEETLHLREKGTSADPASVAPAVAALAAHSPGNIAWRALSRVARSDTAPDVLWEAAAVLAAGLRSLFNRPESVLLLEHLDDRGAYWEKVLRYCAAGNLQAVLDEHLHHLALSSGLTDIDDEALRELAARTATVLALRSAPYGAFDPARPDDGIRLTSRFALRYGGRGQDQESLRQPEIRQAFNSPFWPFVLASTSVGQEGIDFHWWCSALVHWNTPANPVDFEQREGRVDRYAGHAVRRNLAHVHGSDMLRARNPWQAAYELGRDKQAELGEFAPHWIYPGPVSIERHLMPYPLSTDVTRLERLKIDLALYRLTFGQPRQEDMLELLRKQGVQADPDRVAELRIDLSP